MTKGRDVPLIFILRSWCRDSNLGWLSQPLLWRVVLTSCTVRVLATRGTIEEKVYHRQIYKHFLTNKVLKNPQQKRFFKARDMKDLFILQDDEGNGSTETSNIFSQLSEDVNIGVPNDGQQDQAHIASALPSTSEAEPSNVGEGRVDVNSDQADEESNILKSLFDAQGIHVSSIFLIPNKTSLCNASIF